MTQTEVSFDITDDDRQKIHALADRAADIAKKAGGKKYDRLSAFMDLVATHANGCPLDLDRLTAADDFNVAHDVFGINRHIDRDTGKLTGFFLPRFAAKQSAAA